MAEILLERFKILQDGHDDLSQKLYLLHLSAFKHQIDEDRMMVLSQFSSNIYDLVEYLRDQNHTVISDTLAFIEKKNAYIADLVLIMWCLPRPGEYLSTISYNLKYEENIKNYNHKIICLLGHNVVRNFCIETLSKVNNVPIHCIDYIWFYAPELISFSFSNKSMMNYLMIKDVDVGSIDIGLNMPFIVRLGLGKCDYNKKKMPFYKMIESIVSDPENIKYFSGSPTGANYTIQREELIKRNFIKVE